MLDKIQCNSKNMKEMYREITKNRLFACLCILWEALECLYLCGKIQVAISEFEMIYMEGNCGKMKTDLQNNQT